MNFTNHLDSYSKAGWCPPAFDRIAMGSIRPDIDSRRGGAAPIHQSDDDLDALREENKQLRELVIQLSKLVIRNVADRK